MSGAFFVRFTQFYSDKKAMRLSAKAPIACHVGPVRLRFSHRWHSWLIDHGHTVVGYVPVGSVKIREHLVGYGVHFQLHS